MGHDRMQNWGRVGKAGGFDDYSLNRVSVLASQQSGQRIDQITAHSATKAAVIEFQNIFIG